MDDAVLSDGLECSLELDEYASDLFLGQLAVVVVLDELAEILLLAVLKDEVQVMASLFEVNQLDNIFVFYHSQGVEFLVDAFQTFLR